MLAKWDGQVGSFAGLVGQLATTLAPSRTHHTPPGTHPSPCPLHMASCPRRTPSNRLDRAYFDRMNPHVNRAPLFTCSTLFVLFALFVQCFHNACQCSAGFDVVVRISVPTDVEASEVRDGLYILHVFPRSIFGDFSIMSTFQPTLRPCRPMSTPLYRDMSGVAIFTVRVCVCVCAYCCLNYYLKVASQFLRGRV